MATARLTANHVGLQAGGIENMDEAKKNIDNDNYAKLSGNSNNTGRLLLSEYGLYDYLSSHRYTSFSYKIRGWTWSQIDFYDVDDNVFLSIPECTIGGIVQDLPNGVTVTELDELDLLITVSGEWFIRYQFDYIKILRTFQQTISGTLYAFINGSEFTINEPDPLSSTITYKGGTLTTVNEETTKTLKTANNWIEDDITVSTGAYTQIYSCIGNSNPTYLPANTVGNDGDIFLAI